MSRPRIRQNVVGEFHHSGPSTPPIVHHDAVQVEVSISSTRVQVDVFSSSIKVQVEVFISSTWVCSTVHNATIEVSLSWLQYFLNDGAP